MTDLRKAAEQALERLESHEYWMDEEAIEALRQALAMENFSEVNQEIEQALAQEESEVTRLRQVCRNVYEVWAGSEGVPMPETCTEGYLLHLIEQMRDEAKAGLSEKPPVKSYCGGKPNYCTPEQGNSSPNYPISESSTPFVDTVNISQERVDETAKREHEPVVGTKTWVKDGKVFTQNLYASDIYKAPPKREWVGLTNEERVLFFTKCQNKFWDWDDAVDIEAFIRAIEAKLKGKNGG